jgi:hypothetical protein
MRNAALTLVGMIIIALTVLGRGSVVRAERADDERPANLGSRSPNWPWRGAFEVQVLIGGRPAPQENWGGERRVEAVPGAEYELRLTNPLPERVAVAVSVDGLNVIDARHTTAWDASKWVIHPHGTLTLSGWQVGSERARRFYFTTERDAYATRIGRPGDFGAISAVFYREGTPVREITPGRLSLPERDEFGSRAAEPSAAASSLRALPGGDARQREHVAPSWRSRGRAATGIGDSVRSEVQEVTMQLERDPAAVVTLRYGFRPVPPRPIIVPGFAPEPGARGWNTPREHGRFATEP